MNEDMNEELISAEDIAKELGVLSHSSITRVCERLGIEVIKRKVKTRGNQKVSHIRVSDVGRVREECERTKRSSSEEELDTNGQDESISGYGFFYVIQLEPELDPGRFKVGFGASVQERLRAHRTVAVNATVVKQWRCKEKWEYTAIDCVTVGCDKLSKEVFRTDSLSDVVARCDDFFEKMPTPDEESSKKVD